MVFLLFCIIEPTDFQAFPQPESRPVHGDPVISFAKSGFPANFVGF